MFYPQKQLEHTNARSIQLAQLYLLLHEELKLVKYIPEYVH